MEQQNVNWTLVQSDGITLLRVLWSIVTGTGLCTDLGEQRRGRGAEVVRDEQLGVGVDPRWVELPQWLVGGGSTQRQG